MTVECGGEATASDAGIVTLGASGSGASTSGVSSGAVGSGVSGSPSSGSNTSGSGAPGSGRNGGGCAGPPDVPMPAEAGAIIDDAGNVTNCAAVCPRLWNCQVQATGVVCTLTNSPCSGRRPKGLCVSEPARGAALGQHFAEMARLERASVDAFRHLRRELVAHRAPWRLVRAAERAARDEVRHARATGSLARRHGSTPVAPTVLCTPVRDLETIAIENAVEGCVRETFGALVATWQARSAADTLVRATMKRIARDETRHSALALQVNGWLKGRLNPAARARVDEARRQALGDLVATCDSGPPALRSSLGLPSRSLAHDLVAEIARLTA